MTVAPNILDVNLDELTIEEIEILEDILDAPFDKAFAPDAKRGKAMRALAFIAMRRLDPNVTIEDVGKVRINSFGGGEVDPPAPSAA